MPMRFEWFLWAMPAAEVLHICEEYGTGIPELGMNGAHDVSMTNLVLLLKNAPFMAILWSLSTWASLAPSRCCPPFLGGPVNLSGNSSSFILLMMLIVDSVIAGPGEWR